MVDPLRQETTVRFGLENEGKRKAATLAHDDHDTAFAGPVMRKARVDPVGLEVGTPQIVAELGAIDFDRVVWLGLRCGRA